MEVNRKPEQASTLYYNILCDGILYAERFVALKNLGYEPVIEPPKAELGIGASEHRPPKADFSSKTKSSSQSTSPTVPSPSVPEKNHSSVTEAPKTASAPSNKTRSALRFKYCFLNWFLPAVQTIPMRKRWRKRSWTYPSSDCVLIPVS